MNSYEEIVRKEQQRRLQENRQRQLERREYENDEDDE